jgi:hypothetical protein
LLALASLGFQPLDLAFEAGRPAGDGLGAAGAEYERFDPLPQVCGD